MREALNFQAKEIVKSANKNRSISLFAALLLFLIAANWFTISFIGRENYFYFWDFSNYWEKAATITDHFPKDPYSTMKQLYYSVTINGDDYNLFPAFLLLPATFFLGTARMAYILSIVNVFAVAAAASFVLLHISLSKFSLQSSPVIPWISMGVVLFSPNFWNPILFGYLDVGGVIIVNLILFFYLKSCSSEKNALNSLIIALLVTMAILFRRWYAYWAVAFYIASFVEECCFVFLEGPFRLQIYGRIILRIIIQISVSALLLVLVAPTFIITSVTTSYPDIYSAFRFSSSLFESLGGLISSFGFLAFAIFIVGAVQSIFDQTTRRFAIFLLIQWLVIFYLFSKTQDFGPHHFYLFLPAMLLFSALFMTRLVMRYQAFVLSGVSLLLVMNFLSAFSSQELWYRKPLGWILTDIRHPPLVRNDIGEIDRLLDVLRETLTDPGDRVYVLASSRVINSSILRSAYLSFNRYRDISKKILGTHDLDKRDGFPQKLVTANYVIVADPIQYHVRPSDQRVVGILGQLILDRKNIGRSFIKLPYQFNLDAGVKCYLYKKVTQFAHSDLAALSEMFKKDYPDRPKIYQITEN